MKLSYTKAKTFILPLFILICNSFHFSAKATIYPFSGTYSGGQEVPANGSPGTGTITGAYNDVTNTIFYTISFSGLSTNTTAAHFHAPGAPGVIAPVIIAYTGFPAGVTSGTYTNANVITDAQETQLKAGLWYSNIHTTSLPGGEIRTQIILGTPSAFLYSFKGTYSGAQEVPPNASAGTGTIQGIYDSASKRIYYVINFSGLSTNTTAAHFHAPGAPGVIAPVIIAYTGFPAGVTSGTYVNTNVITNAQEKQLLSNLWYSNIHTTSLPGGEIRTQIIPQLPPRISCPANIVVGNNPGQCSASVAFSVVATGTPAPTIESRIGTTVITSPYVFPVGTTTVTSTATNSAGVADCSFTVTVNDTEAPVIANLSTNPCLLWPPNHKMRDVTVNYISSDNCPGLTGCHLSVTSNESVNGNGDGNTSSDWEVIDDHHVRLRAERSGNGNGRTYTIKVSCTDQHGNTGSRNAIVIVPHDMSASTNGGCVESQNAAGQNAAGQNDNRGLYAILSPNPGRGAFMLNIQCGNNWDKIQIRISNMAGRVVESMGDLIGSQVVRVGGSLGAGIYFVQIRQGDKTIQLKLMKVN